MSPKRPSTQAALHVGALALGAVAVIAAAIGTGRLSPPMRSVAVPNLLSANAELDRCRHLTPDQADDAACKRAWAEQRNRFFGRRP